MNLHTLSTVEDLESILATKETVAIFKHSTRCAISSMAYNRIKSHWSNDMGETPIHYLDLIQHRNISDLIEEKTGVEHQSPQLILFKDGEVVYDASHNSISSRQTKIYI